MGVKGFRGEEGKVEEERRKGESKGENRGDKWKYKIERGEGRKEGKGV